MNIDDYVAKTNTDRKIHFDNTVNLGHILTIISFFMAGGIAWSTMDKRLVLVEEFKISQMRVDARQDANNDETKRENRENNKEINQKLDRVIDNMARK